MGIVRFALRFPYTFYVVAAFIVFLGVTDFLVVDAVWRNRSPTGFLLSNREFIANEGKNRGC